jgi:hypothetical protein
MLKDGDYNPGQLRPVVEDRWRDRSDAEYYNKRPAGEKNRSRGNEGKRQPFVSGRFQGGEVVDWIEPSTDEGGARCDGKAGGYLQRLNVWRQRKLACTTAGPRVIGRVGRRGGGMALRARRGASGPEIDAREKSIMDLRTIGIQTDTLQRKELGKMDLTRCLSWPSACGKKDSTSAIWVYVKVVRVCLLRLSVLESLRGVGKRTRRVPW